VVVLAVVVLAVVVLAVVVLAVVVLAVVVLAVVVLDVVAPPIRRPASPRSGLNTSRPLLLRMALATETLSVCPNVRLPTELPHKHLIRKVKR
jgi:hypothetical protein